MSRQTPRTNIGDIAEQRIKNGIYHGRLAEPYDGIGQHVSVSLAMSSVAVGYKARIAAGDFASGTIFPVGTPVAIAVHRGKLEVLSLGGGHRTRRLEDSFFVDASSDSSPWHDNFPSSQKRIRFKDFGVVGQDSNYYGTIHSARWPDTFLDLDSSFELHGGSGTISTQPGGGMDITAGGGLTIHSDGGATIDADGGMTLLSDGGLSLHGNGGIDLNSVNGVLTLIKRSSDPAGSNSGRIYYNTTTNTIRWHNGTAWADL